MKLDLPTPQEAPREFARGFGVISTVMRAFAHRLQGIFMRCSWCCSITMITSACRISDYLNNFNLLHHSPLNQDIVLDVDPLNQ